MADPTKEQINYQMDSVSITLPANEEDPVHIRDGDTTFLARGVVDPADNAALAQVYVKVYKADTFATVDKVPPHKVDPTSPPASPSQHGQWEVDSAGTLDSPPDDSYQLVAWGYSPRPGGHVVRKALRNFKVVVDNLVRDGEQVGHQDFYNSTSIHHPIPADNPYPVNNAPGTYSGTIVASGNINNVTGLPNVTVYLRVATGSNYSAGNLPTSPDPNSTTVVANNVGDWSCSNLKGAGCMPAPFAAPNQLLVWCWANNSYNPTLSNFTGRATH